MRKLPFAKPPKRSPRERQFNSSLPKSAAPTLQRGGKIKPRNEKQSAKRRERYSAKLAAYKRSETYKIVEARANGQCEFIVTPDSRSITQFDAHRCFVTRTKETPLAHHHRTYSRFGGDELPDDILVLCEHHHAIAEAAYPHRRHGR